MSNEKKEGIGLGNYFNSYKLIKIENKSNEHNIFEDLLKIYTILCRKNYGNLNGTNFNKLANIQGIFNENYNKNNLDILFKKIIVSSIYSKKMDFKNFIAAIEEMAKNINIDVGIIVAKAMNYFQK